MKKLITVLCLSALPFTLIAQEPATVTTVATQTAGNAAVEGIKSVADYVARYGEQRVGVGNTLSNIGDGHIAVVLIQQVSLPPLKLKLSTWTLDTSLGAVHTSAWADDKQHEGLGLGVSCRLVKIKPVDGVKLPSIRNLSELRVGISISVDVDEAIGGHFDKQSTVVAVTFGYAF